MKKSFWKKVCCITMAVMALAGMPEISAKAAEPVNEEIEVEVLEAVLDENILSTKTLLADCTITIGCSEAGMVIVFGTGVNDVASVVGVKDIRIQKKNWLGLWDTVAVSSGGEAYNVSMMGCTVTYANAVKGATYRVGCVHYGNVDGYTEGESFTGPFTFTY